MPALPGRLTVGHLVLAQAVGVRVPARQQVELKSNTNVLLFLRHSAGQGLESQSWQNLGHEQLI